MRKDGSFAASTSNFNPFGETQPVSFDFNLASQYAQPHFRSKPRVSYIRPPVQLPFDETSMNGLVVGAGVAGLAVCVYLLGRHQKWWK